MRSPQEEVAKLHAFAAENSRIFNEATMDVHMKSTREASQKAIDHAARACDARKAAADLSAKLYANS